MSSLYLGILLVLSSMQSPFLTQLININGNPMPVAKKQKIKPAPELRVDQWIDAEGKEAKPYRLAQFEGKFKVIFCYQHWCPGCHSHGLPALQKITEAFKDNDQIQFLAVQTVFEGFEKNSYDKIRHTQEKYKLHIPFGHDPGKGMSTIMADYHTKGTPWFIFIDQKNNIVFEDFNLDPEAAIRYLTDQLDGSANDKNKKQ